MVTGQDGAGIPFAFDEIEFLRTVCVLPEAGALLDRIASEPAFRQVLHERLSPRAEGLAALVRQWDEVLDRDPVAEGQAASIQGPGRLLHLFVALRLLRSVLSAEPDVQAMDLHLWRPQSGRKRIRLLVDEPTLLLQPGSLVAEVVRRGAVSLSIWALTAGVKALAPRLVDRLLGPRETVLRDLRARQIDAAHPALLRPLEQFEVDRGVKQMVVFLHGLFSTDAGLFDPLVTRLSGMPEMAHTAYIGFAHNPLAAVEETAGHVADELASRLGSGDKKIPVAFVGHHRGGLVARAAATRLCAGTNGPQSARHLVGSVSFGAPHRGVADADNEARTLGAIVLVAAPDAFGRPARGFMCLSDLLRLRSAMAGEPLGLEDLLPPVDTYAHAGKRRFLDRLQDAEAQARRVDPACRLPLHAIGGNAPSPMPWRWVRRSAATDEGDDWLVATSSSAPHDHDAVTSRRECEADHRSYFLEQAAVDDAAQRLAGWFQPYRTARDAATKKAIIEAMRQRAKPRKL